ncbi:hypothetical protein [Nocardia sp. NPDC057455]|uniref:hypothetical protein n=1 Tax=Nocardia sp. NPDC057455 TaxID=3346138 RepID=UPI00366D07F4
MPASKASDSSGGGMQWGKYRAAVERQESLSRPAPPPTELNSRGNLCLSPAFVEWMMFWPPGWVTNPVLNLSRARQLKILGNGVVPVQAHAAFAWLLDPLCAVEAVTAA